jgi:hypothetical protein
MPAPIARLAAWSEYPKEVSNTVPASPIATVNQRILLVRKLTNTVIISVIVSNMVTGATMSKNPMGAANQRW